MNTGIFYDTFHPKFVFIDSIPLEYNKVGDFLILNLSRAIAGDCTKKICFGLGDKSVGKSTILTACQNTFGDFIGTFNAEVFSHRDTCIIFQMN